MKLIGFRRFAKNSLCGFATLELELGLQIFDCPVHTANGRAWASLPAKPLIDRDGRQLVTYGKPQYAVILKWRDREIANRFSTAVIALVRAAHPDALDDGGAP